MSNNKISELRSGTTHGELSAELTAVRPKRHPRRSKNLRSERTIQRLQIAVVVLVGLLIVAGLSVVMSAQPIRAERDNLLTEVRRLERDLVVATEEIQRITGERDDLVAARIPGLRPLVLDKTLEVNEGYVRNVLFTLTVQEGAPAYEFRVVFSNEELVDVIPNVSVLIFNELGIQVGTARISLDSLVGATGSFKLTAGDVRSYSGKIELTESGEPRYYVVQMQ